MRLFDYMTPARSREEAAMTMAKMHTLSGGAALSSLRMADDIVAQDVPEEKNPAASGQKNESLHPRRRAALRHVLERQF